jgi:hypothetical protein
MNYRSSVKELFSQHTLTAPARKDPDRPYARQLKEFADKVCADPLEQPTYHGLAQAGLAVTYRFLELYASAPTRERSRLVATFINAMTTLRNCELVNLPPAQTLLVNASGQASAYFPQPVPGIYIGEREPDDTK